jgi:hypothetical protein
LVCHAKLEEVTAFVYSRLCRERENEVKFVLLESLCMHGIHKLHDVQKSAQK